MPYLFVFPHGLKRNYKELYVCQSPCFALSTIVNFVWSLMIQFSIVLYTSHRQTYIHHNKERSLRTQLKKKPSLFQEVSETEGVLDTHDAIKMTHCTEVIGWHEASNFTGISPSCITFQLPNFSCTELFLVRKGNKVMEIKEREIISFQQSREMSIMCFKVT